MSLRMPVKNPWVESGAMATDWGFPTILVPINRVSRSAIQCDLMEIAPMNKRFSSSAILVAVSLGFLLTTGCARAADVKPAGYVCDSLPPDHAGEVVTFTGLLREVKKDALHVDLENFGIDFSSVRFEVLAPASWVGRSIPIYYQDSVSTNPWKERTNSSVSFQVKVPSCLDQPWIFWEKIGPAVAGRDK